MWIFKGTHYLLVMMFQDEIILLFLFADTMVTTDSILSVLWNQSGNKKGTFVKWTDLSSMELRLFSQWLCECIWRCAAVLRWQYYRHITAASHWLDQVSAAQDVVRQFILRLIHFLLNCSPNLRCNLSCPCESFCFASLEKMRLCFHVVFFLTVPNISWKTIIFVCSDKIFFKYQGLHVVTRRNR